MTAGRKRERPVLTTRVAGKTCVMARDDPSTQELRLEQLRRSDDEREAAQRSDSPSAARAHARRAERADYLSEKLAEREVAEREGNG